MASKREHSGERPYHMHLWEGARRRSLSSAHLFKPQPHNGQPTGEPMSIPASVEQPQGSHILVEDMIFHILGFCDISSVLVFCQSSRYFRYLASSKNVWLTLASDLSRRGFIDKQPGELLSELSREELVDRVKQVVLGPWTWAQDYPSAPIVSRKITLPLATPNRSWMQPEPKLFPGGEYLFFQYGALDCWSVSEERIVWTHRSDIQSWVVTFAAQLTDTAGYDGSFVQILILRARANKSLRKLQTITKLRRWCRVRGCEAGGIFRQRSTATRQRLTPIVRRPSPDPLVMAVLELPDIGESAITARTSPGAPPPGPLPPSEFIFVEVVALDLNSRTSRSVLVARVPDTSYDYPYIHPFISGDFAGVNVGHEIILFNWRLGSCVTLRIGHERDHVSQYTWLAVALQHAILVLPDTLGGERVAVTPLAALPWEPVEPLHGVGTPSRNVVGASDLTILFEERISPARHTHSHSVQYPCTRALYSAICSGCQYISPVTEAPCCTRTLSLCIEMGPSIGAGGRSCGASLGYPLLWVHLRIVREEREGRGHSPVSDPAEGETDKSLKLHGWGGNDWVHVSAYTGALTYPTTKTLLILYYE
ncbi:hypothetical protein DFH09DRAFT_1283708 [Mycena vulgaris]|nr:hypothetical protein DFH09DRAFT_1283708 [Mycena vulgaris]